jgi:hypothetical protein
MAEIGWSAKSSSAQRAEVVRLAAEGMSARRIAAEVFGDCRYRGRVERILRRGPAAASASSPTRAEGWAVDADASGLGSTALLRVLFERRLAWLVESDKVPSARELRALFDVERRLETLELLERTRPQGG